MANKKRTHNEITRLWANSVGGDEEAIDELYHIALESLPKRRTTNKQGIVADALLVLLNDATEKKPDAPIWVDDDLNITLPGYKERLLEMVVDNVGERTVERFIENREDMLAVILKYVAENGGFQ